ncbi:unnamed protein product [Durusdinium trenchii]|uniref:ABC1 atypical kinase-like domain-containing protein n=1 Tax=Durusdinium trenchii TaxID=1381693 RepID=A0ABP0JIF8_9DINO
MLAPGRPGAGPQPALARAVRAVRAVPAGLPPRQIAWPWVSSALVAFYRCAARRAHRTPCARCAARGTARASESGPRLPSVYSAEEVAEACQSHGSQVFQRFLQVFARFSGWATRAWAQWGSRRSAEEQLAQELREALVELGPSFVKVGQMLSSRVDLLPPAYVEELGRLTDRVAPFPKEEAEAILKEAWPDRALEALPSQPVAAASLGQVYCLDLEQHGCVAVKVQRPGIRGQICVDLYILRHLAGWVQRFFQLNTDLPALVDEYGARLVDELDFTREAERSVAFSRFASKLSLGSVTTARPVPELTTSSVLVTEWVQGERLELTAARDLEEAQRLQAVAMTCYLAMLLELGSLHADPHWGNLLRREDGVLVIIDWGLVADIDDGLRRQILRYVANILSNDYDAIPADLVAMGFIAPRGLMAMEEKQVARSISDVFQSLAAGGTAQQRIADVLPALAEIKQQHGSIGQIPAPFVYILRCFSILEGHGLRLDRNYRIVEDCYPYLANWALRAKASEAPLIRSVLYGPRVQGAVAVPDVNQVLRLLRGLPRLQDLQEASEGGQLAEELRTSLRSLRRARALQEVLLHEAARTLDVLGREVAEASLGPVLATLGFERNEEDEAVLGALKAMQNALQEELVAGEAEELIRSPFRRFVQSLLRRMGTRLNARQGLFESADVARVLWEARPFAMALQMRLMAMLWPVTKGWEGLSASEQAIW